MGTKERVEILNRKYLSQEDFNDLIKNAKVKITRNEEPIKLYSQQDFEEKDNAINDLLKRISELEFEVEEKEQDLELYKQIGIMHYERPYAKRYLEEKRKEIPNLLYPDSEEIYKDYYKIKEIHKKAIKYIENSMSGSWSLNEEYEVVSMNKKQILSILKGEDKE